jgi:hypothetical protein
LIFDGRVPLESGKKDAIIIEARQYSGAGGTLTAAFPYTPPTKGSLFRRGSRFAVHRPKILGVSDNWREEIPTFMELFFRGVSEHEEASKVWEKALDESI